MASHDQGAATGFPETPGNPARTQYAMRMTLCKCGHPGIEHYDSYDFCTWTTAEPPECECEKFEAAGPEIHVQIGQAHV